MKEIKLNKGFVALVDDEDFERLSKYKWRVSRSVSGTTYAFTTMYLHKLILPNHKKIDHIDRNGLNNQKINLRAATDQENALNKIKYKSWAKKPCSSIYKGLCWNKKSQKWQVGIRFNNKMIYLGMFDNEIEAAKIYNKKMLELYPNNKFIQLNTI